MGETTPERSARLTSGGADLDARERAAGVLLRLSMRRNPLNARELARVRGRLIEAGQRRTPARRRVSAAAIAVVLSTIALGAGAASQLAPITRWLQRHLDGRPPVPANAPPLPGPTCLPIAPIASGDLREVASPAAPTTAPGTPARPPAPRRPPDVASTPRAPADRSIVRPARSALGEELALFEQAIRLSRRAQDAEPAIAALREYLRRFPDGTLRSEAELALARTLLASARPAEALGVLDGMPTQAGLRGRELAVLRAELRSRAGRCAEALEDFDAVLAAGASDAAEARAAAGRERCVKDLAQPRH